MTFTTTAGTQIPPNPTGGPASPAGAALPAAPADNNRYDPAQQRAEEHSGPDGMEVQATAAEAAAGPPIAEPDALSPTLGLTRSDIWFAFACGCLILLLLIADWARHRFRGVPLVEIDRLPANAYEFRIDINTATWVEWMQLEGIGESLARRIVEDRERNGPFTRIEHLQRVSGIGPKTLERLKPHLDCRDCPSPTTDLP